MKTNNNINNNIIEEKSWTEVKADSSWVIFRVMAEFVEAFESLNRIGPCVSIFGSARTKPNNKYYPPQKQWISQIVII